MSVTFRIAAIFCLLATVFSGAQAQSSSGQTYVLAAKGDPTPDGLDTIAPDSFALSNAGAVYLAHLTQANVSAVFSASLAGKTEILRVGNQVAGAGKVTGITGNLWTNIRSQALLYVTETDSSNVAHDALVVGSATANVKPIVISGQTIPDHNGQFNGFGVGTINDAGDVGFWGAIQNGGGPLITTNGIFIGHQNGTITQVMRSRQNAPGETNPFYSMDSWALVNQNGQICFSGEISDSHSSTGYNYGIYRASSSADIVKIARSYESAPGTGWLFGTLDIKSMNDAGAVAFYTYLIDSAGTFKGRALFKSSSSATAKAIAYTGQNAPNSLGVYTDFDNTFGINNAGQSAYVGYYQGATAGSGVFIGDGVTQRSLVRSGQTAPDGSKFIGFALARANDLGTVAFAAQLNNSSALNGIYLTDGVDTIKVAQVGDIVNGVKISQLGFDPKAFNDFRQLVYQAIDSTGSNSRLLLFAPNLNWRTNGDGSWTDAANWTASLVPASNNDVSVAPTTGGKIAGPLADVTVKSLKVGAVASGAADLGLRAGVLTATNGVTGAPLGKLSGNGRVIGNVVNQSVVAPGDVVGSITVQGNYTQAATGALEIEIGGTAATSCDNLAVTGSAALNGALKLSAINHAVDQISAANSFAILNATGTITGVFSNAPDGARLTTSDGLASFQVNYTGHAVVLSNFIALDSDGDGIPDYWSQQYFSHAVGQSVDRSRAGDDGDGDGISNLAEYIAGTSPTNAASALRAGVLSVSGNALSITFPTVVGRTYSIESSAQPGAGSWASAVTGIVGDGTVKTISLGIPSTAPAAGFYRVSVSRQ